jgi:hypothetical protein
MGPAMCCVLTAQLPVIRGHYNCTRYNHSASDRSRCRRVCPLNRHRFRPTMGRSCACLGPKPFPTGPGYGGCRRNLLRCRPNDRRPPVADGYHAGATLIWSAAIVRRFPSILNRRLTFHFSVCETVARTSSILASLPAGIASKTLNARERN